MSIVEESRPCWLAQCDKCNDDRTGGDGGYLAHFPTRGDAEQELMDIDWVIIGGHVWCDNCVPLCDCGHGFGAHNYDPCDECECDGFKCLVAE